MVECLGCVSFSEQQRVVEPRLVLLFWSVGKDLCESLGKTTGTCIGDKSRCCVGDGKSE